MLAYLGPLTSFHCDLWFSPSPLDLSPHLQEAEGAIPEATSDDSSPNPSCCRNDARTQATFFLSFFAGNVVCLQAFPDSASWSRILSEVLENLFKISLSLLVGLGSTKAQDGVHSPMAASLACSLHPQSLGICRRQL